MGRMKNFDRAMYKDVFNAIRTLMDEQMRFCSKDNGYIRVYSKESLNAALAFLCVNNISHTYSIRNINTFGLGDIKSVISIQWFEDGMERSCIFFGTMSMEEDDGEM